MKLVVRIHMHYVSKQCLKATKKVIRYTKRIINYGVKYCKIQVYSNWEGSLVDMKNKSGTVLVLVQVLFLSS